MQMLREEQEFNSRMARAWTNALSDQTYVKDPETSEIFRVHKRVWETGEFWRDPVWGNILSGVERGSELERLLREEGWRPLQQSLEGFPEQWWEKRDTGQVTETCQSSVRVAMQNCCVVGRVCRKVRLGRSLALPSKNLSEFCQSRRVKLKRKKRWCEVNRSCSETENQGKLWRCLAWLSEYCSLLPW